MAELSMTATGAQVAAITPEELRAAGEALYGEQWQSPLARVLGVDSRRVRHWLEGDRPIPAGIRAELVAELRSRAEQAAATADALARPTAARRDGSGPP